MQHVRLPRFKRSSEVPAIRLTARDLEILAHVHRHRFLRSSHLTSLLPGSQQRLLRRLQLLYHHGFLERPRCQIDYYHRGGSRCIAYGFGNKGAGLMKHELSLPFHQLDWPKKNGVQRLFLEHALLVSDFMVALELACRKRSDIRLLTEEDLEPADEAAIGRHPFRWRVNIPGGPTCSVIPDCVFGLELTDGSRTWFVLEADRATMPVMRSDLDQSSFRRKMLAYQATWAQNIHRTQLGWERFQVLTLTSSDERICSMIELTNSLKSGKGLFLFSPASALSNKVELSVENWQSASDPHPVSLFKMAGLRPPF